MSFDTPAYMRRARDTEAAWNAVVSRCRRQRDQWLKIPRLRLTEWLRANRRGPANAGSDQFISVEAQPALIKLAKDWQLDAKIDPPIAVRSDLPTLFRQLVESFDRFNQRWTTFLNDFDLQQVNQLRRDYNEYYVLEKECAVLSAKVARQGFKPLPDATTDDLRLLFPLLPELC